MHRVKIADIPQFAKPVTRNVGSHIKYFPLSGFKHQRKPVIFQRPYFNYPWL
jgi:hypothetical protein